MLIRRAVVAFLLCSVPVPTLGAEVRVSSAFESTTEISNLSIAFTGRAGEQVSVGLLWALYASDLRQEPVWLGGFAAYWDRPHSRISPHLGATIGLTVASRLGIDTESTGTAPSVGLEGGVRVRGIPRADVVVKVAWARALFVSDPRHSVEWRGGLVFGL